MIKFLGLVALGGLDSGLRLNSKSSLSSSPLLFKMIHYGRTVLMNGERLEKKAQSYLVRKPESDCARWDFDD